MGTKILHTADIHLREFEDERWDTLVKLLRLGAKEKVGLFVISGDLFNEDIDAEKLRPKIREVFSNNPFRVVIIPGNHDRVSFESGKYFGEDITVLQEPGAPLDEYEDCRIFGIPFEPLSAEKFFEVLFSMEKKLKTDKKNIILFHGELLDYFFRPGQYGDEGDDRYMPVRLSYFKDFNIDYVLAGHFHSDFECWEIEPGIPKYFVYPGSPISITKREVGVRKVNIFNVGDPPNEVRIDTPYYDDIVVELNPLIEDNPINLISEELPSSDSKVKPILTVKGFVNCGLLGLTEKQIAERIKSEFTERCDEVRLEFQDVESIFENDLYNSFILRLDETEHNDERKEQIRRLAIEGFLGASS